MTTVPDGLDPKIQTREIVFEADVSLVTPFRKLATVSRGGAGHMTFASDEGPSLGGLGSAPTPVPVTNLIRSFPRRTRLISMV